MFIIIYVYLYMFNNKIYNLSSSSTGVTVYGMNISGGTTNTIYNNIIGDLSASAANLANAIRGIDVASTNANIYNNTVRINATSTGVNFGTSAFNTSSVVNLDLKNNIFLLFAKEYYILRNDQNLFLSFVDVFHIL